MKLDPKFFEKLIKKISIFVVTMAVVGCSAVTGNGVRGANNEANNSGPEEITIPVSKYSEGLFDLADLFNMNGGKDFPLQNPKEQLIDNQNLNNINQEIINYHSWGKAQLITPENCQYIYFDTSSTPAFSQSPDVRGLVYKEAYLDFETLSFNKIKKIILPLVSQSILVLKNTETTVQIFNALSKSPSSCWRNISVTYSDGQIKTLSKISDDDLNFYKSDNIFVVSSTSSDFTLLLVFQKIGNVINHNSFYIRKELIPKDIGWGFLNNFIQNQTALLSNLQQVENLQNYKVTELAQYTPDSESFVLPQLTPAKTSEES
jgi:hypothetical protein